MLFLKLGWTSKVFLLWKPLLEREVISAVKLSLLLTSVVRVEVLDLLKTEGLASLNRLEGALDAAGRLLESRRVDCFYWGESCFHRKQQWLWMIVLMNSKTFTVYATVTCPLASPDWGTVEIVTCWRGYCSTQWLVLILNSNRIAMLSWMLGSGYFSQYQEHLMDIHHMDPMGNRYCSRACDTWYRCCRVRNRGRAFSL